ncbi:MAG: hypothetical protein AAGC58_12775 [Asticcacaulis sp.]
MATQIIDRSIDHSTLARMMETGAVQDAKVVGDTGGWKVIIHAEKNHSYFLSVQRKAATPRVFKKMDTLIGYLKSIGIEHFAVDAAGYAPESYARPDRAAVLKQAHEAAAHDKWFREQVSQGIAKADSPNAVWISNDDAKASWAKKRAELKARLASGDKA